MKSVKDAIQARRAATSYDPSFTVSKEQLDTLIDAGYLAPSSLGIQQAELLVIQDPKTLEEVSKFFGGTNANKIMDSGTLFLPIGLPVSFFEANNYEQLLIRKLNEMVEDETMRGNFHQGFIAFMKSNKYTGVQDMVSAALQLGFINLQATDLDLDGTIMGGFDVDALTEYLTEKGLIAKGNTATLSFVVGKKLESDPFNHTKRIRIPKEQYVKIV